jgi:hypothetical protein
MALKIVHSKLSKPFFFADSGVEIKEDFFVRYVPLPFMRGFNAGFEFNFFTGTEREKLGFKDFNLVWIEEITTQPTDDEGNPVGEPQTIYPKRVVRKTATWSGSDPLNPQYNAMAKQIYQQVKDNPVLQAIEAQIGDINVLFYIMTHLAAKKLLEDIFGNEAVELALDLQ